MKLHFILSATIAIGALTATAAVAQQADQKMSFFITSVGLGDGANLGGLAGADKHCADLAAAVGSTGKEWHAYLSTTGEGGVNARDRIGSGPWYNVKGVEVAKDVDDLHSDNNKLSKEVSLTEKGTVVNGVGDKPNQHDMLTGTQADGTAFKSDNDTTCSNWTSNAADGSAELGHFDRKGGGAAATSWNAAHPSRGCGQANLVSTGGAGLYYCFAAN